MKVCHITTVHPRIDMRIFYKECFSLREEGYDVTLIVADGEGCEEKLGISIIDLGIVKGRLKRILLQTYRAFKKAKSLNADIYHFHDPELLIVGLFLAFHGKKAIFDAHEDIVGQIKHKTYLNKNLKPIILFFYKNFERFTLRRLFGVIAATEKIKNRLSKLNPKACVVCNYPIYKDYAQREYYPSEDKKQVVYIGGLSKERGIIELVQSTAYFSQNVKLKLAGFWGSEAFEKEVQALPEWKNVDFFGWLPKDETRRLLQESHVGVVTLHPIENHLGGNPIKMYEYFAVGLPVVASDFPGWKEVVAGGERGVCVNPHKPKEIADAILSITNDYDMAKRFSKNGIKLIKEKCSWEVEAEKLKVFYSEIKE